VRSEDRALAATVVRLLSSRAETLAVAESCTGGLVGAWITTTPGASAVYWGGVIAYVDEAKVRLLGVGAATLRRHGAVSEATAREMAAGVRDVARSRWGVGVTGIAGPGGATPEKPAGTVCIAVDGPASVCRKYLFPGSRDEVRRAATREALRLLGEALDAHG